MSNLFRLSYKDLGRGLLVAVLVVVLQLVSETLKTGGLETILTVAYWNDVLNIALSAALAYLLKNFATSKDGKVLGRW